MRIGNFSQFGDYGSFGNISFGNAAKGDINRPGAVGDHAVKPGKKVSPAECETCKNRKYVDGSNEGDVSFKTPGHISPGASAGKVMAHEQEHVANAYEKEAKGDAKVLSATVTLKTAVCPECGTSYVAGGETRTAIAYQKAMNSPSWGNNDPYAKNKRSIMASVAKGNNVDLGV